MNNNHRSLERRRYLTILLLAGVFLLANCQRNRVSNGVNEKGQRGFSVTRFDEVKKVIPVSNGQYALLLATEDNQQLSAKGIFFASEYGEILNKNKPILGEESVRYLWGAAGRTPRVWAESQTSLFLIDTPQRQPEQTPIVDQTAVKKIFDFASDENLSKLVTVPNTRSAWLVTRRSMSSPTLYFLDADSPTPAQQVVLPQGYNIEEISSSPDGNLVWLLCQNANDVIDFQSLPRQVGSAAIVVEKKASSFSLSSPITGKLISYPSDPFVPIKEGRLAWKISRDWPKDDETYSGTNPGLLSSDGKFWSVSDFLFMGAKVHSHVSTSSDCSRMWVRVENKPGLYLVEATADGPKINKELLRTVPVGLIRPGRDGLTAWVLSENGRRAFYINADGSEQELQLDLTADIKPVSLVLSPNERKAWLVTLDDSAGTRRKFNLRFLNRDSNKNPQPISLPANTWFVTAAADNRHAFLVDLTTELFSLSSGQQLLIYLLTDNTVENAGEPISRLDIEPSQMSLPTFEANSIWFDDGKSRTVAVKWNHGVISSASLALNGKAELTYEESAPDEQRTSRTMSVGTRVETAQVNLVLNNHHSPDFAGGSVQLCIRESPNREVVKTPQVKLQDSSLLQLNWTPRLNYPYDVELTFRNDYGTKSILRWTGVEFASPLFQRPWFRTVIAFVFLCGLSALTLTLRPINLSVRRWLPLVCAVLGSGTTFLDWASAYNIDASLFIKMLVAAVLLLTAIGFISPLVYRTLAQVQPFHIVTPYFLLLPWARRRMYALYARWSQEQLHLAKTRANDEVYTPIPVTFQERSRGTRQTITQPATEILKHLTNPDHQRASVLIEAPGGQGKSALFREVIQLSLLQFMHNPGAPLPVICDGNKESIDEMVSAALGKYAISPETLATQIQVGHFFLAIDGLGKLQADKIGEWVKSEKAAATPLLIASRPNDELRLNIQAAERCVLAEPQRLTDETLGIFESGYLAATPEHLDLEPTKLSQNVKNLCRGPDGTYLPILVRLALLVGPQELDGISRLYEYTFKRLLRDDGGAQTALLDEAGAMCVDTYWKTGQRTIVFDRASKPRADLIKRLLEAGVLVPADTVSSLIGEPREVRFFHDSMQSYLTARGLLNGPEPWAKLLANAAGHPRFREAKRTDNPEHGSELFRMCLQVFGPQDELKRVLQVDLLRWAHVHNKRLTRYDVEQALPSDFKKEFDKVVAPELGAGAVLTEVVRWGAPLS